MLEFQVTTGAIFLRNMATQHICLFNKFGYCKYKEVCRKEHVDDICSDSPCDFLNCRLRHPKLCNWYSEYGRCKFNPCKFKHEEKNKSVEIIMKENSEVMSKLKEVEKSSIENLKQFEKCVEEIEDEKYGNYI